MPQLGPIATWAERSETFADLLGHLTFEGFVRLNGLFGLERIEVANAVATQATIKTRARGLRAKKRAGDGQQIIQGQKQRLSEFDYDQFLSGCERGLKPLRGVGRVMEVVSALCLTSTILTAH